MRVLGIVLGVLAVLAVAALAIGPRFVDWNRFKPEIAALAERATGGRLTIDGDVALSVLPTPTLSAAGVRLLAPNPTAPGSTGPELMHLTSLDARIALGPLLAGHVVVRSIALIEPHVVLDAATVDAWAARRGSALDERVSVDRVLVVDGSVDCRGADGAVRLHVDRLNAEISADAPGGPYRANGDVAWRGLSWRFDGSIGGIDPGASVSVALGLRGGGGNFRVVGTLLPGGAGGETLLGGHLRADARHLPELLAASDVAAALAEADGSLPAALGQPATLEAALKIGRTRVALDDLALTLGDDVRATGALGIAPTSPPSFDLTLAVNRIDVARWAARLPAPPGATTQPVPPGATTQPVPPGATTQPAPPGATTQPAPPGATTNPPSGWRGALDLTVDAVFWGGGVIRQARLAGALDGDGVTVRQAGAQLPGGSDVGVFGRLTFGRLTSAPPRLADLHLPDVRFEGRLEGGADNLRGLFAWLALDLGAVPPDRLRRVSITSGLVLAADRLELDGLDLRFDASRLTGSIAAALGARPAFGANLRLDRLNLEAYLPRVSTWAASAGLAWLDGFDANLELAVDQLSYDTVPLTGVHTALTLDRGALSVHTLEIASVAGIRATARGALQWAQQPAALDVTLSAQGGDPAPLLQLLGDDQATPSFGPLALSLHAAGPADHVALALDAALAGGTLDATGEADLAAGALRLQLTVSGVALGRVLPTVLGTSGLDGTLEMAGDLTEAGSAAGAPLVSLTAAGQARMRDVVIQGLDLGAIAALLRSGARVGDGAAATLAQDLTHGRSAFATLDAGVALHGTRLTTDDATLAGADGSVSARGGLDVATRALDLTLTVQPTGDPAAPPAIVRLDGALAAPERHVDAQSLAAFLAARH